MASSPIFTPASSTQYVIAVVIMLLIAVAGSVVLEIANPNTNNTILIAQIFGFLTPTTLSLLALMKSQETHLSVNSRMDGMIEASENAARAEGEKEGREDANKRTDSLKKDLKK